MSKKLTVIRRGKPIEKKKSALAPVVHKLVKKELDKQEESKYAFYQLNQSPSNTAIVSAITMPSQGDAYNNRDGDSLMFTSVGGRFLSIAADTTNVCRLVIFQWLVDSAQDAPTAAKILQDSTTLPAISPFILNRNERKKFKVLYDKVMGVSGNGPAIEMDNFFITKFARTDFNAAATSGKGILYILYVSDSGAVSHPTVQADITYRWRDL